MKIKKVLIMRVNWSIEDFDDTTLEFTNPVYVMGFHTHSTLEDKKIKENIKNQSVGKLFYYILRNMLMSFAFEFKTRRMDIVEKILDIMNITKEK